MERTTKTVTQIGTNITALKNHHNDLAVIVGQNEVGLSILPDFKLKTNATLEIIKKELTVNRETKLDRVEFVHEVNSLHADVNEIKTTLIKTKADADTCCNYLEKYSPVYI